MKHGIFNDAEAELIAAAKMVLSDGVRRLKEREGMFPTNRAHSKADKAEARAAREAFVDSLRAEYGALRHEVIVVALIDAQGRLIAVEAVHDAGKAAHCSLDVRRLAGLVIESGAVACVLAHNHPSGEASPSEQDVALTKHIKAWLEPIDCCLIDHLVITADEVAAIIGDWI